jgi:hypothetical protein
MNIFAFSTRLRKCRFRLGIVAVPVALLLPSAVHAATYYVATNGSDSNPGTSSSPVRTIQDAVNMARPGDTILVGDGTYGAEGAGSSSMPVNIYSSGTSSAWITLKAEHKGGAVLDCQLKCHSYVSFGSGSAYWRLEDFDITRGLSAGVWGNSSTHDIIIKGNHFHNIGNISTETQYGIVGFYSGSAARNIKIDGNLFNDIGRTNSDIPNHDHGLYLQGGSNLTVTNNVFYNMFRGWGVQLSTGPTNVLIANNTFAFANPYRNGQIVFDGSNSGVTITDNIFYKPTGSAVVTAGGSYSDCTIAHNIIYGPNSVTDGPYCSSSNNQFEDPKLIDASSAPYDFHLQSSSPAIDAATAVSEVNTDYDGVSRPQGQAPDIGACEYHSSTSALPGNSSTSGLAAYWNFNESGGQTAEDSSGNQNTAVLHGNPAWATGKYGSAILLNGSGQYLTVPESPSLEAANNFSVAFWISPSKWSHDAQSRIISKTDSWYIKLNNGYPQLSAAGKYAKLSRSLTPGSWQHVVFTLSNGSVTGYLNGAVVGASEYTFSGTEVLPAATYGLTIGTDASLANFYTGALDDIRIYNRSLSSQDVASLYSQAMP